MNATYCEHLCPTCTAMGMDAAHSTWTDWCGTNEPKACQDHLTEPPLDDDGSWWTDQRIAEMREERVSGEAVHCS